MSNAQVERCRVREGAGVVDAGAIHTDRIRPGRRHRRSGRHGDGAGCRAVAAGWDADAARGTS